MSDNESGLNREGSMLFRGLETIRAPIIFFELLLKIDEALFKMRNDRLLRSRGNSFASQYRIYAGRQIGEEIFAIGNLLDLSADSVSLIGSIHIFIVDFRIWHMVETIKS